MFKPNEMLNKYISKKPIDRYGIIGALIGYINIDPKFQTNNFNLALDFVFKNGVSKTSLYESFNPDFDFETNKEKWNLDYYSLARVCLKENFCPERIKHVKEVANYLFANEVSETTKSNTINNTKKHVQIVKPRKKKGLINRIINNFVNH